MGRVKLAPSVLAADFARLGEQIREAEEAGADWVHLDVMDGHFVPNLTLGPAIAAAARRSTSLPLDVHLMVETPGRVVEMFAQTGVDSLTVHVEATPHLHRTVQRIRELGLRAGVAINPATPIASVTEILPFVDLVLVMTVNPGFGGQSFIPTMNAKIARLRALLAEQGLSGVDVEVDGGIDAQTARAVVQAGATVLVAGSAVFNSRGTVAANLAALRASLESASEA
jgi:ribulose-phosphate 3-epimerase